MLILLTLNRFTGIVFPAKHKAVFLDGTYRNDPLQIWTPTFRNAMLAGSLILGLSYNWPMWLPVFTKWNDIGHFSVDFMHCSQTQKM